MTVIDFAPSKTMVMGDFSSVWLDGGGEEMT